MADLLSPGIQIKEFNNTLSTATQSSTLGGFAGAFVWGPVLEPRLVSRENELVNIFGKPNDTVFTSFFTASNFLAYSGNLFVTRVVGSGATNASSRSIATFSGNATLTTFTVPWTPAAEANIIVTVGGNVIADSLYTLTGNSLVFNTAPATGTNNITVAEKQAILNDNSFSLLTNLPSSVYAKFPGTLGNSITVILADSTTFASLTTQEKALFSGAPTGQEVHFAVIDTNGAFTGVAGTLLERKEYLSKTTTSLAINGETQYYKSWINRNSSYVRSTGTLTDFDAGKKTLIGGISDDAPSAGQLQAGFGLYLEKEKYDISIIVTGNVNSTVAAWVLSNVAGIRNDIVVCISPELSDVLNASGQEATNIIEYRTALGSSSFGIMDSGWKLQLDIYNDVERWVPLNGDIGGIIAESDRNSAPWISPAGRNRGGIKNVIRLAWNPTQAQRDAIYSAQINPVISEFGVGSYLFGDKTLLTRPSAFDRINVRRLFIIVEKTIAETAKFVLFEPNNEFTRASFRGTINPYLRNIQGSGGIEGFIVICDESNNNEQIRTTNQFVADIKIAPTYSTNFITLNFIATRDGISFNQTTTTI
jgi:hypothetical protein